MNINRNIILFSNHFYSDDDNAIELDYLHKLLYETESTFNICIAHEVIDLNKYTIIKKPLLVQHAIAERLHKSFVFISCKN